jgi:hypothetical protein
MINVWCGGVLENFLLMDHVIDPSQYPIALI